MVAVRAPVTGSSRETPCRARNPDGAHAHGDVVGARCRRDEEDLDGNRIDLAGLGATDGDPHGVLGDRRTSPGLDRHRDRTRRFVHLDHLVDGRIDLDPYATEAVHRAPRRRTQIDRWWSR